MMDYRGDKSLIGPGSHDRPCSCPIHRDRMPKSKPRPKTGGTLVMTYDDGSVAKIKVPASAICKHKSIRLLCDKCEAKP